VVEAGGAPRNNSHTALATSSGSTGFNSVRELRLRDARVLFDSVAGESDDGNVRELRVHLLPQPEAVLTGHRDIGQDNVGLGHAIGRVPRVATGADSGAQQAKGLVQQFAHVVVWLDDDDADAGERWCHGSPPRRDP
jgi:hypothetical protein